MIRSPQDTYSAAAATARTITTGRGANQAATTAAMVSTP
jgi:hypothetical protein